MVLVLVGMTGCVRRKNAIIFGGMTNEVVLEVAMVLILVGMTDCVGGSNVIGFSRDDEWRLLLHRIYSRGAAASFCICPHLGQIIFII